MRRPLDLRSSLIVAISVVAIGFIQVPVAGVEPVASNDNFSDAIEITDLPYSHEDSSVVASLEVEEFLLDGCYRNEKSTWYRLQGLGSYIGVSTADPSTGLGSYSLQIEVFRGNSFDGLELVTCDSDSFRPSVRFEAQSSTTYYIRVSKQAEDAFGFVLQVQELGVVTGTLTGGGSPIQGCVSLYHAETGDRTAWTYALKDGTWKAVAPAGSLKIYFSDCFRGQHQSEWYDNKPTSADADLIQLEAGTTFPGVDADLDPIVIPEHHHVRVTTASEWILLKVTAGSSGAEEVRLHINVKSDRKGAGPRLWGRGSGGDGRDGYVSISAEGGGRPGVAVTENEIVELEGPPTDSWISGFSTSDSFGNLGPGETAASLHFMTGMEMLDLSATARISGGDVTVTATSGQGTTVITAADAEHAGLAVRAGGAAVGGSTHQINAENGLVGGFMDVCNHCDMKWQSPDDRSGSYHSAGARVLYVWANRASGSRVFAGPPGEWNFRWDGVMGGKADRSCCFLSPRVAYWEPFIGALAEIGPDWELFSTVDD